MKIFRMVFVVLVFLSVAIQESGAALSLGHLVIIGGALRSDNAEIGNRIVALAGGKGAKIAIIPAAAADPESAGQAIADYLRQYGADPFVVPISARLKNKDLVTETHNPATVDLVRHAGGVFFVGGDQVLITKALRTPDGQNTPVLEAIWDVYRKGGVIAGSSAGAAIMSEFMYGDAETVIASLKRDADDEYEISQGLGFVGPELFVDQHTIARGRFARMISLMIKKHYEVGLGIDENSAMVVDRNHDVEILGYKGAIFIDLKDVQVNRQTKSFNASNVRISYLDHGDRFNYISRSFSQPKEKLSEPVDRSKPYYHDKLFSADILGNSTILEFMENLIDGDQPQAIGLAISDPDWPSPELGFRFVLTRGDDSAGFWSNAFDSYSVLNLRLDIQPILIKQPFFSLQ